MFSVITASVKYYEFTETNQDLFKILYSWLNRLSQIHAWEKIFTNPSITTSCCKGSMVPGSHSGTGLKKKKVK